MKLFKRLWNWVKQILGLGQKSVKPSGTTSIIMGHTMGMGIEPPFQREFRRKMRWPKDGKE